MEKIDEGTNQTKREEEGILDGGEDGCLWSAGTFVAAREKVEIPFGVFLRTEVVGYLGGEQRLQFGGTEV